MAGGGGLVALAALPPMCEAKSSTPGSAALLLGHPTAHKSNTWMHAVRCTAASKLHSGSNASGRGAATPSAPDVALRTLLPCQ